MEKARGAAVACLLAALAFGAGLVITRREGPAPPHERPAPAPATRPSGPGATLTAELSVGGAATHASPERSQELAAVQALVVAGRIGDARAAAERYIATHPDSDESRELERQLGVHLPRLPHVEAK